VLVKATSLRGHVHLALTPAGGTSAQRPSLSLPPLTPRVTFHSPSSSCDSIDLLDVRSKMKELSSVASRRDAMRSRAISQWELDVIDAGEQTDRRLAMNTRGRSATRSRLSRPLSSGSQAGVHQRGQVAASAAASPVSITARTWLSGESAPPHAQVSTTALATANPVRLCWEGADMRPSD
jgi:hypothetical protein